ncbi:SEED MATURATION PROTEIN 1 [Cicer arietinum]|uniref:Uncharacterized protein LOC101490336 n=1 Tax=Cicer arietinum TaxID=3827 RepID=A0A1S2XIX1_CICAR|nr:uncharacterized protein LOC101490336 [Cicer arietinum]
MAKSKDDIKYGTAQARLSEDEAVRVVYKHGTPLEGGKIADSEQVDLFTSDAHNISKNDQKQNADSNQSQLKRDDDIKEGGGGGDSTHFTTGAPCLPHKNKPPTLGHKF